MPATTVLTLTQILERHRACQGAREWSESYGCNLHDAWDQCERGDWLLWIAATIGVRRRTVVYAACQCARLALARITVGDEIPRRCIETTEAWCRGEATIEKVRAAKKAAAGNFTFIVAAAATNYVGRFADVATDVATAVVVVVAIIVASHDGVITREATMKRCAELVREVISFDVILEALEADMA